MNKTNNNKKQKHVPLRMCICCRQMFDKSQMVRIIKQDGVWSIDTNGKAQTRGMYLCNNAKCIQSVANSKRMAKSYGQDFCQFVSKININNEH